MNVSGLGKLKILIAEKRKDYDVTRLDNFKDVVTVHIGGDASGTTFDHYSGTYYRALVIRNYTADYPPPIGQVPVR